MCVFFLKDQNDGLVFDSKWLWHDLQHSRASTWSGDAFLGGVIAVGGFVQCFLTGDWKK